MGWSLGCPRRPLPGFRGSLSEVLGEEIGAESVGGETYVTSRVWALELAA